MRFSGSEARGNGPRHVAVFAPLYPPAERGGGPIQTLASLVSQKPDGFTTTVVAGDRDLGSPDRLPVEANVVVDDSSGRTYFISADKSSSIVRAFVFVRRSRPDIIYVNSFFSPVFSILTTLLWTAGFFPGAQLLIAPRGEFSSGALRLKSAKKHLYTRVAVFLRVPRRAVWHASSPREKDDIEKVFGSGLRIVVREDETALPAKAEAPVFSRGALRIAYVGRMTEMKGLHRLVNCASHVRSEVMVDAYGSREDQAYVRELEAAIRLTGDNVKITLHDWIPSAEVRSVLSGYDLFAFPTSGENFGHVIAEALSVSCPVVCADNTPWTEVLRSGGGIVMPSLAELDWATMIDDYASLTSAERHERRLSAGHAYEAWRRLGKGHHVFEGAVKVMTSPGSSGEHS